LISESQCRSIRLKIGRTLKRSSYGPVSPDASGYLFGERMPNSPGMSARIAKWRNCHLRWAYTRNAQSYLRKVNERDSFFETRFRIGLVGDPKPRNKGSANDDHFGFLGDAAEITHLPWKQMVLSRVSARNFDSAPSLSRGISNGSARLSRN
jgi:hypothetical protein